MTVVVAPHASWGVTPAALVPPASGGEASASTAMVENQEEQSDKLTIKEKITSQVKVVA